MRRARKQKWTLCVSEEALENFQRSSTAQRLRWLDEMRAFLSEALPPETKRIIEELRAGFLLG